MGIKCQPVSFAGDLTKVLVLCIEERDTCVNE